MREFIDIITEDTKKSRWKNLWKDGETANFEYHCHMAHNSCDAELWYRSHQPVVILRMEQEGNGSSPKRRCDAGEPRGYRVEFADGFTAFANEDELLTSTELYDSNYDPPPSDEIEYHRGLKVGKS